MRNHHHMTLIDDDPTQRGLSLRDVLWGLTLVLMIVVVGQIARQGWGAHGRVTNLRENVVELRQAIESYRADHGAYPAAPGDFNRAGDPEILVRQLTEYTDARGEPSAVRDDAHPFGPYLESIPAEPISGSGAVRIDTRDNRLLPELSHAVAQGSGRGGWYYEARSGHVVANLGETFPAVYARF